MVSQRDVAMSRRPAVASEATLWEAAMAGRVAAMSPLELMRLHAMVMEELAERKVIRTRNNPVADYAELLVCRALSLKRAGRSTKGYDAEDCEGNRFEIKSRRLSKGMRSQVLSPIRDLDGEHFQQLVVVVFADDYSVARAFCLPRERIAAHGAYRKHVNGWMIPLRASLWSDSQAVDITAKLRASQCE
jgi:hypothetical protein